MAPKALTDCPENLREAIDWLVQVRHCGGVSTLSSALSTLFDNVAQDAEKSLPSLLDTDRPSARDVVSKLRAFQSTLPKDSENPHKNIIHNLCASACSLLGYRYPGTYDGSGIVYGNASRLCDAILAFLYAVFSDVHDNQPYVAGRSVLRDDVIVPLKSQLWRGHQGFCQVIPKVSTGLRDYNAAVKASNEKVKEPIETVLEYVKPDGELRKGIEYLQITEASTSAEDERTVESAVSLVERCKEVAKVFSKSLTAVTNAIDDLNPKLKRKLENARRSFFNHVDWLSKWSNKGEKKRLDKMIQKIKSRLKKLATVVKEKIKQEVHTVVELLKKRVREIKMKLEGIAASLERYVKELGTWMGDAKEYIKKVREYVNRIMKQLDGENRKKIDEAAADIDSELGKKVGELNEWIKDAEAAVNVAKEKADEVYGRLNKDDKDQKIGQGIDKITTAKKAVSGVSTQLETIHEDLESWKGVAEGVLRTAVERAEQVHDKLNPDQSGEDYPIGANIKNINDAKNEIDKANTALGKQVENLHKWIETAENIRQKAEEKAKEAYDKLDVHEALSQNVQKIVEAKEKIEAVNKNVTIQLGSLNQWNDKARSVLDGAVQKAEEVWKGLNANVGNHVVKIEENNNLIKNASESLENQVKHLGKWKDVANEVIDKAGKKCDEILKKVKTDLQSKDDTIFNQATLLKDQGKKLLNAAQDAKQKVEQRVKDALDAVKEMDTALKQDLFEIKNNIGEGITKVIQNLEVEKLGERVKEDLQKLRGRIEGLKDKVVDPSGNGFVNVQISALSEEHTKLKNKTQAITEAGQEVDKKFNSEIKDPLEKNVQAVENAIQHLYNKINPEGSRAPSDDSKKLNKILEHIHGNVENILNGEKPEGKKGLQGIANGLLNSYAKAFRDDFETIVKGWTEASILKFNGVVWKTMGWETQLDNNKFSNIANGVKSKLIVEIKNGKNTFNGGAHTSGKTTQTLKEVMKACETFADKLDGKMDQVVRGQVTPIVKRIQQVEELNGNGTQNSLSRAEAVLCALSTATRQVSKEIQSILLDSRVGANGNTTSIAAELDRVLEVNKKLNDKLEKATNTATPVEANPTDGTAQAVDKAIEGVSREVGGL